MLKAKFEDIDLEFDQLFYKRCATFISLLQQWGVVHNLTAQLNKEKIEHNILDSVYPLKFINDFKTLADIGTGAGYPGMLLAIARPKAKVTLIEPRAKRVAFLNFVKNSLGLLGVTVVQNRVEKLQPQNFDLISSRAVTNTSLLLNLTTNISDINTEYLFYKGTLCDTEIKEASVKNYEVVSFSEHRNYLYIKRKG